MAKKRVFIVHGWDGYPEEGWFPWLRAELEKLDFLVQVPAMPNSAEPKIDAWVNKLKQVVGSIDENCYFVGHSIGAQAVLRYLESLSSPVVAAKVVLVAPWMELDRQTIAEEGESSVEIARPWVETPIDFDQVKKRVKNVYAIFSDNDPFVPVAQKELFKQKLSADVSVEKDKGHFSGSDNVKELPIVLRCLIS